jgi:HD-GYP domain-containing protein (c-di-GMP phosphodiesterase class II)
VSTAASAVTVDPELETALVDARRRRRFVRPRTRELTAGIAAAAGYGAAALAMLALPFNRPADATAAVLFTIVYAILFHARWEAGTGICIPTQLVLVPMLLILPPPIVPACVAAGLLLGRLLEGKPTRRQLERVPLILGSGWHAVAPALALFAAGQPEPSWRHWPLYVLAFAAQVAVDFGVSALHDRFAYGVSVRSRIRFAAAVYTVDAALAPVGFLAALVARDQPAAVLLVLPVVALFAGFSRERRARMDNAIELSSAYRGTALLLGDVVEADDAYTGSHSRDVVDLVLGVCDELGLDARTRRDAEFVALLHDVGKIRVPGEIINKPGPLDDEEWAIMKMHTIEGERMLSGVGGLLAHIGNVVRSCHERWDGAGYPDGLAGAEIPLLARIVMACDAYSAMTTDRAYRRAMTHVAAIGELRANEGKQFDPHVVDALVVVATRLSPGVAAGGERILAA